jgi:hypothetical protein
MAAMGAMPMPDGWTLSVGAGAVEARLTGASAEANVSLLGAVLVLALFF